MAGNPGIDNLVPLTGRHLDEHDEVRNVIELVTGGYKTINSDHAAVHYGLGFCCYLYLATLAGAAVEVWRFKGPTNLFAHIKAMQVSSQGATLKVELIKDPTITVPGTEVVDAIQNLNHNSTELPQSKFFDSAVAFTGGKVWCSVIVHGDTTAPGGQNGGTFIQNDNLEYVTKDGDTDYILQITNLSAGDDANNVQVNMFFYEEPEGIVSY